MRNNAQNSTKTQDTQKVKQNVQDKTANHTNNKKKQND